jgi:hypothetical protein
MRQPQSWTSSIVGFALALLLVAWAVEHHGQVITAIWPLIAGLGLATALLFVGLAYWRRRDYW